MATTIRNERWILAATILGSSIVFIDGTVVSVALPVLQSDLKATVAEVQWVVEAYTLCLAALILVGGSLGDQKGRRRVYVAGTAIFAAASVACGLAPDARFLIIARAIQGIGGAMLTPGSLAIITATFPEERRGSAIGTWSAFSAATTSLGPPLGGFFMEHLSWRWVFFINLPLAALAIAIALWKVPENRDESAASSLDWLGAILATTGLGLVVYGLTEATNVGLQDPRVIATCLAGVATLVVFLIVEMRSAAPMMPLSLFLSRNFSAANLLTLFLYGGLSGSLFFLPFNLIQVQGYTTTEAGAAMLPFAFMIVALSRWMGGLVGKIGPKIPLVVGPLIFAAGTALYAFTGVGGSYWTTYFPIVLIQGLGMGIAVAPLTTVVMSSVAERHAGLASGINNAVSRTGGLLAVAMVGVVALAVFGPRLDQLMGGSGLPPEAQQAIEAQRNRLASIEIPPDLPEGLAAARAAIGQAFVASFHVTQLACAALAAAAAVAGLALQWGESLPPTEGGRPGDRERSSAAPRRSRST